MAKSLRTDSSRKAMTAVTALAIIVAVVCGYQFLSGTTSTLGWIVVMAIVFVLAIGAGVLMSTGRTKVRR